MIPVTNPKKMSREKTTYRELKFQTAPSKKRKKRKHVINKSPHFKSIQILPSMLHPHDIRGAGSPKRARSQPAALDDVHGALGEVLSSSAEDEDSGFIALIEEINRNSTHNYLLHGTTHSGTKDTWPIVPRNPLRDVEADALGAVPASTKRRRTETSDVTSQACKAQSAGEDARASSQGTTHDSLQTLTFLVLFSEFETQFLARIKASLGTHDIPYDVREEQATNAFLAARSAMAAHGSGTARTTSTEATAATHEDRDRAALDARNYFNSQLPERLMLAARLVFS
jgi:hypothetical protein